MKKNILFVFILFNFVISVQLLGESEFFPFSMVEFKADMKKEMDEEFYICTGQQNTEEIPRNAVKVTQAVIEGVDLPPNGPKRKKVLSEIEKALKPLADSGISYAQFYLGGLYWTQKKFDLAEKYYKLGADRGYLDHNLALGALYKEQKKYDLAENHFLIVINYPAFYDGKIKKDDKDRYPLLYQASLELGELYSIQKKYDLAKKYYQIAAESDTYDLSAELEKLEKQIKKNRK